MFCLKVWKERSQLLPLGRNCGMVTCFFSPTVVRVWFDKQDLSRKFVILIFFQCFPQYFTFFIISFALSRPKIFQRCKRPKKLVIFSKDFNPQLQRYIRQHASEPYSIYMQIQNICFVRKSICLNQSLCHPIPLKGFTCSGWMVLHFPKRMMVRGWREPTQFRQISTDPINTNFNHTTCHSYFEGQGMIYEISWAPDIELKYWEFAFNYMIHI